MEYRSLGRCGLRASVVGVGCEGFLEKSAREVREFVDVMQKGGVNIIDLYAPNPDMRTNLGLALEGRRDGFILQAHLCTIWKDGQYKRTRDIEEVKISFSDQLERLKTDHVEIGMIHYVDALSDWETVAGGDVMRYALELKKQGVIGSIGLSSHNPKAALAAVNSGLIDVLMFSVNPCYDLQPGDEDLEKLFDVENYKGGLTNMDPDRQALYETCQRLGVGITVMKPFGGGDLLDAALSPAGAALTVDQCIAYALDRPAVASVLCGARTKEEMAQCLTFCTASDEARDYASALASFPHISWEKHCMYCGHCAPCPVGISVADVTKFLNLCLAQGNVPETVREHYALLPVHASSCIECGACESRCPFHVEVRENMRRAAEVFGD